MQFPTVAFAVFFIAAFTMNWLLRPFPLAWRATMVAASLYFCGWIDIRLALVVVAAAVVNALLANAAHERLDGGSPTPASRRLVRLAVAADVGLLGVFAYHRFFIDSATDALGALGLSATGPVLGLVLPVGLSFVTLHAISYVVDVGRGDIVPVAFGDLLLYLCFFPHLVAGPAVRIDELVPQFHERPDPRRVPATDALVLVAVGLVKAVVIAGYLGTEVVDPAFASPGSVGGAELLVAVYAFAVQIYAGFSGLTDIAIGCGLLLGIDYPDAFAAPYRALSVREFWERWNITVSAWMRDYLYVPLGGNRHGPHVTRRNVMVTMVVGGLWYGAGWTFALWGALHGGFLLAERALEGRLAPDGGGGTGWGEGDEEAASPGPIAAAVRGLVTFHLVCLAWVFYRADSVGDALGVLGRIATAAPGDAGLVTPLVLATVAAVLAGQLVRLPPTDGLRARVSALAVPAQAVVLAATLTLVAVLAPDGASPFARLPF
jgi:alginate O-acetyltransferase complex protein AlgI